MDVSYQYLSYFLEDDDELQRIHNAYESGEMLTGELKKIAIKEISAYITKFQQRRAKISDEELRIFMDGNRELRLNPRYNWPNKVYFRMKRSYQSTILYPPNLPSLRIQRICLTELSDTFRLHAPEFSFTRMERSILLFVHWKWRCISGASRIQQYMLDITTMVRELLKPFQMSKKLKSVSLS